MKKFRIRTLVIMVAVLVMALPIGVSAASTTLYADYARAKASLSCSFRLKALGNDSASACTERTYIDPASPTKYRMAVRLEAWENKSQCTKYSYKNGDKKASTSLSAKDVVQFASRHSIDNSNNTKELAAKSFYDAE